jgi:CrcB protein
MLVWAGVAVAGGAGACARFLVDRAVERHIAPGFPLGTLVVNVTGAFLLGLLAGADVAGHAGLLWGTALLGGYTTFSTWMLESAWLQDEHLPRLELEDLVVPLVLGLAVAAGGWELGAALW